MSEEIKAEAVGLPSGRTVKVRPAGALEHWYTMEQLPDAALMREDTPETPATAAETREDRRAAIQMVLECSVEPDFWADMRTAEERAREPLGCPKGKTRLDLSLRDLAFLAKWLQERLLEDLRAVRPTSGTATG